MQLNKENQQEILKGNPGLDEIAAELYDFCCAARSKDGKSPREVGCEFSALFDEPKRFYRTLAMWHIKRSMAELVQHEMEMHGG